MKGLFQSSNGELFFIRETTMESIDDHVIRSAVPWSQFEFVMYPSVDASGGILFSVECSILEKNWILTLAIFLLLFC